MFEVGRVVVKTAGRDARKVGVVVDVVDNKTVTIDGQVRRRNVNVGHVEPLAKTVDVAKGASTQDVAKALDAAGFPVKEKKNSHKSATRQVKKRAQTKESTKKE